MPNKHKEFQKNIQRWQYSWDSYTGDYLDDLQAYLPKNAQRESDKEYEQRQKTVDPVLVYATAIDSINGMVPEEETQRDMGELGDPQEAGSIAYNLMRNVNGAGLNWMPFFKQVGIKNTVFHTVWGLVDGKTEKNQQGSVKIINPTAVENWWPSTNPIEVLVREDRDTRTGVEDDFEDEKTYYVKYTLEGWIRYEKTDEGLAEVGRGAYEYYRTAKRKERILPIYRVNLPIPRPIGWLLAKKQNHIFNQKSARDWGSYILSFAILIIAAEKKEGYQAIVETLKEGSNAMWEKSDMNGKHRFIGPPSDHLAEATNILKQDFQNFAEAAFKQYGNVAKQLTATQIQQESRTGIEAFLKLLVGSIDAFENAALWRLEQVYFPDSPSKWGQAKVERSKDFKVKDVNQMADNIISNVFNNRFPLTKEVAKQKIYELWELSSVDTAEIDEGIVDTLAEQIANRETQETDIQNLFGN